MSINDLTFGVELECYLPESSSMSELARAVSRRLGSTVHAESYNHHLRGHWKIVTDASLGDVDRGIELVSPILQGADGFAQVEKVCEALQDFGCTVGRKCGVHIHVGVGAQPLEFFKRVVKLYSAYEGVIDAFMPESRRASNNGYCRSMTSASTAAIDGAASLPHLIQIATGHCDASYNRYFKVNLKAYARHKTVEYRQHSGTLDARKVNMWTKTCLRMTEKALSGIDFGGRTQAPMNRARPNSKAYQVGQMLLRPEGVTRSEVMTALNWPSVSIPQQAGICGIDVNSQRSGREVRYWARHSEAGTGLTVSLDAFCELIGSEDSERQYLRARTENMNGPVAWAA